MAEEEPLLPDLTHNRPQPHRSAPHPAPQIPLPTDAPPPEPPPVERWTDGAAFWLLGLCNNLPYVVMLSAARDILQPPPGGQAPPGNGSGYDCNPQGTGAVLLADILPSLLIKMAAPFGIHLLPYNWGVVAAALSAWGSFALLASFPGGALGLVAVALASAASGLGEVTFLALASGYPRWGVPCWASGTGGAGLGGALGYGALLQLGLPLPHALLPGLALPPITLLSYFFLLGPPPRPTAPLPHGDSPSPAPRRWRVAKEALPHAAPLALVYFAEYFINQGLLELLYFPDSALTHNQQYRWYQLIYQGGVFVSRSSLRCLRCRRVGLLALLQVLNAGLLLAAVPGRFLPGFGAACALVGGEGLVGGGAYGNAFGNAGEQAAAGAGPLAMAVTTVAEPLGVALAGGAALGVHRLFCGA